jgi:uncharacterized protein
LAGGSDGSAALAQSDFIGENTKDNCTGLNALDKVEEISILYLPDLHMLKDPDQATIETIAHCENLKNRILIIDAKKNSYDVSTLYTRTSSKYAAFYYPWIKAYNPLIKNEDLFPPGGFVAGIYARNDIERGVHKSPTNEIVRGSSGVEFALTKGEQDLRNPRGINCIRVFQGRGILLWGARTTTQDSLWKYVNVRRLFIYLEESIKAGTQWVVFEPNNEKLWNRVKQTIVQFLTTQWKNGALMGKTSEEAFFVKCDRTTMTQDDIDNGRLIVVIGVAPTKPAEFVIFKIGQWSGVSEATE